MLFMYEAGSKLLPLVEMFFVRTDEREPSALAPAPLPTLARPIPPEDVAPASASLFW